MTLAVPTTAFAAFRDRLANELWRGIGESCRGCQKPDCMGYLAVAPRERRQVLLGGMQLVQVNGPNGPTFIDTYPRDDEGAIILGTVKPHCPYRAADGSCGKHTNKPLVCDLYPLGAEMHDGALWWVIYLDCAFIEMVENSGLLPEYQARASRVVDTLREDELAELAELFRQSADLATWPEGPNRVVRVKEVNA